MHTCSQSDLTHSPPSIPAAGIIERPRSLLEQRMMAAVVSSIKAAEAIIAVVDSADAPEDALAMFQPGDNWTGPPMAVLLNKSDLMSPEQVGSRSSGLLRSRLHKGRHCLQLHRPCRWPPPQLQSRCIQVVCQHPSVLAALLLAPLLQMPEMVQCAAGPLQHCQHASSRPCCRCLSCCSVLPAPSSTASKPYLALLLQMSELEEWYKTHCKAVLVFPGSALNSDNVEVLKAWAADKLPEGPTLYPKSQVGGWCDGVPKPQIKGRCMNARRVPHAQLCSWYQMQLVWRGTAASVMLGSKGG